MLKENLSKLFCMVVLLSIIQVNQAISQISNVYGSSKYTDKWKIIDQLDKTDNPESALHIAAQILQLAKKENNPPQEIKAVIYIMKYKSKIEENPSDSIIKFLEREIKGSVFPVIQILESFQASAYWNYYQTNKFKILAITNSEDKKSGNIATWDAASFYIKITELFKHSLLPATDLQKIPINLFDDILDKGNMDRKIRPDLYDFLTYRAIDFFSNHEEENVIPVREFVLSGDIWLVPLYRFIQLVMEQQDTNSYTYMTLLLYMRMISRHSIDINYEAIVYADLGRLEYIYNHVDFPGKNERYYLILNELSVKYAKYPVAAEIIYRMANLVNNGYRPQNEDSLLSLKKIALLLCNQAIDKYPASPGAGNCMALKSQILMKSLSIRVEANLSSETPEKFFTEYENFNLLFIRVAVIEDKVRAKLDDARYDENKTLQILTNLVPVYSMNYKLPLPEDHEQHSVELPLPSMKYGNYVLIVSNRPDFARNENNVACAYFTVSDLRMITENESYGDDQRIYILNSKTGKPVPGATIEAYTMNDMQKLKAFEVTSDSMGFARIENAKLQWANYMLSISKGKDRMSISTWFSRNFSPENHDNITTTYLFTDRTIYRPGQVVYFKGIVVNSNFDRTVNEVAKKYKTTVTLFDPNTQKVASLEFVTNEFGSFAGSFILPSNVLTGGFQLFETNGSSFITVEEYKRPGFEIKINPVTQTYRLNDTVKINGSAISYSGISLSNAFVKYRVVRNANYPFWYWWWLPVPTSPVKEILNGVARTDNNGLFKFDFKAIPDPEIPEKNLPRFSYSVFVDVTDINGETQSTSVVVKAGYVAVEGNISAKSYISINENAKFKIVAENLNGTPVKMNGIFRIFMIHQPASPLRDKLWNAPDQFVIDKKEYTKLYPNDPYTSRLNEINSFPKELIYTVKVVTNENIILPKDSLKKFGQGTFEMVFEGKDTFGANLQFKSKIILFDEQSASLALNEFAYIIPVKNECQPGEKAIFILGSAVDAYAIMNVDRHGKLIRSERINVTKGQKLIIIPVEESDRGDISFGLNVINTNRVYTFSNKITVPWSNKKLDISLTTFGSKIEPGKKETWRLNLAGPDKEIAVAEVIAGMYDASLDAIRPFGWNFSLYPKFQPAIYFNDQNLFGLQYGSNIGSGWNSYYSAKDWYFDKLNLFGLSDEVLNTGLIIYWNYGDGKALELTLNDSAENPDLDKKEVKKEKQTLKLDGNNHTENKVSTAVQIRKNLNETAFFYPDLIASKDGDVILEFTTPEALTRWKLQILAHTADLKSGYLTEFSMTQKELMVTPNPPRFFRSGDEIYYSSKLSNLSDSSLTGKIKLELFDPYTLGNIDSLFSLSIKSFDFSLGKKENKNFSWHFNIPSGLDAVICRITAISPKLNDGEEIMVPVLPDKILVTESVPFYASQGQAKTFKFDKLINSKNLSNTLENKSLTLEVTPNPAWYAVMALPYLMEYPYECTEQIFNRFYANSIALYITTSYPSIKGLFEKWKSSGSLVSPLEKNEDLKSIRLEETRWVREGQNETEQRNRLGMLFNENMINLALHETVVKLKELQNNYGAWPWFKDMYSNRYITQYIVSGFGHLSKLGIKPQDEKQISSMIVKALAYLDNQINTDYTDLLKYKIKLDQDNLGFEQVQYFYARSFRADIEISKESLKGYEYWKNQVKKYWVNKPVAWKAMIALALQRMGDKDIPSKIIASLKEYSLNNDEMGMHWKDNVSSWSDENTTVQNQSILIEAFSEISNDTVSIDKMKIWLLKQKQVQAWSTTTSTADACYSILLKGGNWMQNSNGTSVYLGDSLITVPKKDREAGTGYYSVKWKGNDIKPENGNIRIEKKDRGITWGALHWQYFEQLDKITASETPLKVQKEVYLLQNTDNGPVVKPVTQDQILKVGDKIRVRIILKTDRQMNFIHLKDMRASALEPLENLSGYEYKGGIGYYKSIRDASVNYFFDVVPAGTFVFEYTLVAGQAGVFENGIATAQCMYAPEFNSHSAGIRIKINK